jgi:hypothetical protein
MSLAPRRIAGPGHRRSNAHGLVAVCLVLTNACSGGMDPSGSRPLLPVTLAWDQPDGLAEYYTVRTGALLKRTEQPSIRLDLPAGSHVVEVSSCNVAGCSHPTSAVLEHQNGHWILRHAVS